MTMVVGGDNCNGENDPHFGHTFLGLQRRQVWQRSIWSEQPRLWWTHGTAEQWTLYTVQRAWQFVHGVHFTACTAHCTANQRAAQQSYSSWCTHSTEKQCVNLYSSVGWEQRVGRGGGRSEWNADAPFLDDIHALRLDHYNPLTYIFIVMKFKED